VILFWVATILPEETTWINTGKGHQFLVVIKPIDFPDLS
jgi:hypothetical protein